MKDFFNVMGKAFAVVFGSTSALALVLLLLALVMRPVLRSWSRETPANTQVQDDGKPDPDCIKWDKEGRCTEYGPWVKYRTEKPKSLMADATPESFVPDRCWDEKGRSISCDLPGPVLFVHDCIESGCVIYSGNKVVGSISRDEITKARWTRVDGEPGFTPQHKKTK